jgi:hypothetical protein
MLERYRDDRLQNVKCITQLEMKPVREVVWVILAHFRTAVLCCCCRCGHVGNALALSIMSIAMATGRQAWRVA